MYVRVLSSCSFVLCVFSLSSFCVVLSSLLFPCVCSSVMYLCLLGLCSVSALCLGLLFLCVCVLCCVCCLVCVCWVFRLCSVSTLLCVYVLPLLCVCSLVCVYCMCLIYVWRVSVIGLCICVYVSLICMCVLFLRVLCLCVLLVCVPVSVPYVYVSVVSLCVPCICLFLCMYVVYVSTVFYVYCICYVYVCFSVVCLCCWLPCWCGVYHGGVMGACFLGLVVLVFWGCGVCEFFLFFYSRFGVGGRLLLGFCYRTFFCRFPWGLCHARNFFKDITHSYDGYVAPVMSLYMRLLAYLYHTRYCSDIAPVYTCARVCLCPCSYLFASVSPLCFIPCYMSCCACPTPCLVSTCTCSMF